MKRTMNSQKYLLYAVFIIMLLRNSFMISASSVISIDNKSCKYMVTLPQGWDTIPQSFLKEKLKQFNVDLGIYPTSQNDYTDGNYALICFIPAIQSLNAFTFKQIVAEISKSNEMTEIKNDTLQIHFNNMNTKVQDGKYHIYSSYSFVKDTIPIETWQMLYLTKFGYLSAMFYKKENGAVSIDKAPALLSEIVTVQPDYQYTEYVKKGISVKHILLSLAIGILVYILITVASKIKKQK